jgi:hypothetical protein
MHHMLAVAWDRASGRRVEAGTRPAPTRPHHMYARSSNFVTAANGREHTLWCREVDDVAVALEHVDLLDSLDWLDVELLERSL